MLAEATSGTPLTVPVWIHVILWPVLALWVASMVVRRRDGSWPRSARLAVRLAPLCFVADTAAFVAGIAWPTTASNSFVFLLLWFAVAPSVTTYLALSTRGDGGGGDGGPEGDDPGPPWWPDFERDFRDYVRDRPRTPAGSRS